MMKTPSLSIEERVQLLEQQVEGLLETAGLPAQPGRDDWQTSFAMFRDDAVMKEIILAGQQIREENRRQSTA